MCSDSQLCVCQVLRVVAEARLNAEQFQFGFRPNVANIQPSRSTAAAASAPISSSIPPAALAYPFLPFSCGFSSPRLPLPLLDPIAAPMSREASGAAATGSQQGEGGEEADAGMERTAEAVEELYRVRDTFFPRDPAEKLAALRARADAALAILDSLPPGTYPSTSPSLQYCLL